MSHYNTDDAFKAVSELIDGSVSAEECFCMILSMLGEEQTKLQFHNILQNAGVPLNKSLLTELSSIYSNYFSMSSNEDFLDVNQDEGESFGDELDMELALALSVTETHLSSATASRSQLKNQALSSEKFSQQSHTSYASKAKSHQTSTVPVPKSVQCNGSDHGPRTASAGASSKDPRSVSSTNGFGAVERASSSDISSEKGSKKKKKKKKGGEKQQVFTIPGLARTLSNKPVIYWLRRDLRLHDNPALVAAYESTAPVIVTFLWNETEEGPLAAGGATKYWLHFALSELDKSFQKEYSNRIVFRKVENSQREMMSLVEETGAESVLMNNLYEPCLKARDDKISALLTSKGVTVKRFDSYLLHTPASVSTDSLGMRGIGSVTHFMECCRQSSTEPIGFPEEKPRSLPASKTAPFSQSLDELGLSRLPQRKDGSIIDWAKVIRASWDFSENGAWEALDLFVDGGIRNYEKESGRTDTLNTSRISPYLHFGQISPRTVLRHAQGLRSPKFLRKLAWRDLSYWLLMKFPDMPSKPMRVHYQNQRWSGNKQHLKAWQKGNTGYPLVDAAMRQLWLTGWMNNYARHVVASFLISYLHFHWEHGYKWFQDTLLDADVAINAMMWQNGGMSGLDQWNFVMHPVDAALTCDPQGHYVRKWCPELAGLPDDFIHKPWKCPPSIMRRAGVELGSNYPHRIITDLEEAREQSLKDVVQIRRANPQFVDPYTGNDLVLLPSGLLLPVITRREFKYKTAHPEAKDNPHTAVLRGYRSRKRDEAVAFANKVDFTASTLNECSLRHKRYEQNNYFVDI